MISIIIPTFNAALAASRLVCHLDGLSDKAGVDFEIVLVDDGSKPEEYERLQALDSTRLVLLRNRTNRGRSSACNTGATAARGERLLFLDSDCLPATDDFLSMHMDTLNRGADVSLGPVLTRGNGFWSRYQRQAMVRRMRQFAAGKVFSMTSANMMVKRDWFLRVGGFDEGYRGYGFEDRDLLLRLKAAGARLVYTPEAGVYHEDELILAAVVRKMEAAGRSTAPRFRSSHRQAYEDLGYAALDVSIRPWLIPIAWLGGMVVERTVPYLDPWLARLPFTVATPIVKVVGALAFMRGTLGAAGKNPANSRASV